MTEQKFSVRAFFTARRAEIIGLTLAGFFIFTVAWAIVGVKTPLNYILSIATGAAAYWLWKMRRDDFARRAAADSTLVWDVTINGVDSGSLTDMDLARIQLDVWRSPGLFLEQIDNAVNVMMRVASNFMRDTPGLLFWFALGCAAVWPADTLQAFRQGQEYFQAATPEELLAGLGTALRIWIACGVMALLTCGALTNKWYGLRNIFADRYVREVRIALRVPAEGHTSLTRRVRYARETLSDVVLAPGKGGDGAA